MAIKHCAICGAQFVDYGRGKYCNGSHYKTCVVCGKTFEYDCRAQHIPETCSRQCASRLSRRNATYSQKICNQCGKLYVPTSSKQKTCKECKTSS